MKSTLIASAVVIAATMLFAAAEAPKTIKVVGLEDDKDNATVVAPAELTVKPTTVAISADALTTAAAADSRAKAEAKANTANIKALTVEGMVIPPSSDLAKTLENGKIYQFDMNKNMIFENLNTTYVGNFLIGNIELQLV